MSNVLSHLQYNLEVAKPAFIRMMKELNPKAGRWIQYVGHEIKGNTIFFKFKSSQNSMSFEVYGGYIAVEAYIPYAEIYQYFKEVKQPYIEY